MTFPRMPTTSASPRTRLQSTSSRTIATSPSAAGSSKGARSPSTSGAPLMTRPMARVLFAAGALGSARLSHHPTPEPPAAAQAAHS
eukprot:3791591-Alexandrium_andersonii.AAC.1